MFVSGQPPPERGELEAGLRELAGSVPCLSCIAGPDAYTPASVWEALRDLPG